MLTVQIFNHAKTDAQVTENQTAEDTEKPVRWRPGSPTCSRSGDHRRSNWRNTEK
ncbi:hypothetical protein [Desmonostoc muscorum]|uniref:hypothetical protein n=1 Tax=Desmonostoc muscorum TaxID=1179 RepID=UPI001F36D456|nr:hypothetical protein [Desmonostoc muscorum]